MLHREKKSSNYTIFMKQTNKNSSNKTVQVFLFCFSLQSDKMFMEMLRFNFIRFQQIHCSSFKFETHSYTYQYQKQKGIKYMYDQIYKLKIHLHNVMIRFSAWSLICVLLRIGRFLRNSRMCETKLCCLCEEDQEDWKTGLVIPESFLARTPSQAIAERFEDEISR